MNIGSIFTGILLNMYGFLNPAYAEIASRLLFNENPERIPNLPDLVNLRYRDHLGIDLYQSYARQNGYNQFFAETLFKSSEQLLNPLDAITAWRRGIISEDTLNDILAKSRLIREDIETLKRVTEFFPSAPDLVRFAIREVYSPEIVEQFGQMADLPSEFLREANKAGLKEDQARNYWAAHWELPSILQGFEMLHRGVIDIDTLNMLLRALDVMPYWRDKLTAISYNPLTRVDVRRMFRFGVLDDDGVLKAYKDIGYNDENANLMLQFTKRYETEEDTAISRATVVSAYKKDIITVDELAEYLSSLGYAEDSISLIIAIADYDKYDEYLDIVVEDVITRYRIGDITIDQAKVLLGNLDVPASYIDNIINKEKAKTAQKIKLPSKADVERWLKLQLITEKEYSTYMKKQGYADTDISKYLEEINKEVDTSVRKFLPVTTYTRWFVSDIINEILFRDTLKEMKYSDRDIENLVKEAKQQKGE